MSGTAFTCPECGASARSAREIATGSLVKCPSCSHVFRFGEEPAPSAVRRADADEPPRRRRDEDYDDDRPRRRDEDDDRRIRSRRDDDYDDRPRSRRRDDDDYDDRPRRRRKSGGAGTRVVVAVVFLLMIVGIAGGVLAYAYKSTGSNEVVQRPALPPPQLRGGGGAPVGENGFGPSFDTNGLNNPEEPGEDKGKLTTGAASLLNSSPRGTSQPRKLAGPPPAAGRKSVAGESGVLSPDVLNRVKSATVMIFCKRGSDGRAGSGSGFFVDKNLVMTNAHVVGMLGPNTSKPQLLHVIINSGDPDNEAKCDGEVLVADREHDLALVRCGTPDNKEVKFPAPLPFAATSSLNLTQQVWVFGYPLGEQVGKRVTVNRTEISSIRPDKHGTRVQTNRGMDHGNSGGPVVDAAGQVIGVSVAGIKDTNINFAVAGDHGMALLEGHLDTITASGSIRKSTDYTVPITIDAHDPLKKITSVTVEWWWGAANEKNAASRGKPAEKAGRQKVTLKREKNKFAGEIVIGPSLQEDKVLWVQLVHSAEGGNEARYEGLAVEVLSAAETKPVTLAYHPRRAEGLVGLRTTGIYRFATPDGGVHTAEMDVSAVLREERVGRGDGSWVFREHFPNSDKFKASISQDGASMNRSLAVLDHEKHIKKSTIELAADEQGKVKSGRPMLPNEVPEEGKRLLGLFTGMLARGVELASVPLPSGSIDPGHTWKDQRKRPLGAPESDTEIQVDFEYKYVGLRKLNGREVAELSVSGEVGDNHGETDGAITGKARGTIYVDVKTGVVSRANLGLDVNQKGATFHHEGADLHSTVEVNLQRE